MTTMGAIESVTTGLINIINTDLQTVNSDFKVRAGYPHEASQIPYSVYVNVIDMSHEEFGQGQTYKGDKIQKRKLLTRVSVWTPRIKDTIYTNTPTILEDFEDITDWTATDSTLTQSTDIGTIGTYSMNIMSTDAKPLGGLWLKASKTFINPVDISLFTKIYFWTKNISRDPKGLTIYLTDNDGNIATMCVVLSSSWTKTTCNITDLGISDIKTIDIYFDGVFAINDNVFVDYMYVDSMVTEAHYIDKIIDRIQRLLIVNRGLGMNEVCDCTLRGVSPLLFDESLNAFNRSLSFEVEYEEKI